MKRIALFLLFFFSFSNSLGAQTNISYGPILGRLSSSGVGVWARTRKPGEFRVRYGRVEKNLDQLSPAVKTKLARDNTGWIHLRGLKPDTRYYYQVESQGKSAPSLRGTFRTLPTSELYRHPKLNPRGLFNFRFEFACGNNQSLQHGSGPSLPTFKTLYDQWRDKIYFSIQNGDWLYEDERRFSPTQWRKQVGITPQQTPPIVRIAPSITGVWENYKIYLRRGKNLRDYHRVVPTLFTFDDHEILNDVWGAGSPGLRDRRAVFRDIGVQAWYDYLGWSNPVRSRQRIHFGRANLTAGSDVLQDPRANFSALDLKRAATLHVHWGTKTAGVNENALDGVGGDKNAGVYEIVKVLGPHKVQIRPAAKANSRVSYSIGCLSFYRQQISNCDMFFLDTRTHRQMHDTRRPAQKGLSMLGKRQKKWLLDGLKSSQADFLFVISSVNFMVPHIGGGKVRTTNKDDAWTVFLDEREQLIRAFHAIGKPVFVLTGDLHNSFVIKITDRVWEFASGPHNSNNHWASDEGNRPASGPFQYGPRKCDIRWSTYFRTDIPRQNLQHPTFCVVQVNNVFNNPKELGKTRWVAFPRPQVVFQYYAGRTGNLLYAESISATSKSAK